MKVWKRKTNLDFHTFWLMMLIATDQQLTVNVIKGVVRL